MAHTLPLADVAAHLDDTAAHPRDPGLLAARSTASRSRTSDRARVRRRGRCSSRTIEGRSTAGANLLIVHHGLFWGGAQPHSRPRLRAPPSRCIAQRRRASTRRTCRSTCIRRSATTRCSLASSGSSPTGGFARFQTIDVGVTGECDVATATLAERAEQFARARGRRLVTWASTPGRRTRRWAICTGAGASSETLREARRAAWTRSSSARARITPAVEAPELGIAVLYAGHYATETFGVRALGAEIERTFGFLGRSSPRPRALTLDDDAAIARRAGRVGARVGIAKRYRRRSSRSTTPRSTSAPGPSTRCSARTARARRR